MVSVHSKEELEKILAVKRTTFSRNMPLRGHVIGRKYQLWAIVPLALCAIASMSVVLGIFASSQSVWLGSLLAVVSIVFFGISDLLHALDSKYNPDEWDVTQALNAWIESLEPELRSLYRTRHWLNLSEERLESARNSVVFADKDRIVLNAERVLENAHQEYLEKYDRFVSVL